MLTTYVDCFANPSSSRNNVPSVLVVPEGSAWLAYHPFPEGSRVDMSVHECVMVMLQGVEKNKCYCSQLWIIPAVQRLPNS